MEENIKEKDKEIEKENGIDKEKENGKTEIRRAPDRLDDIMLVMDMEKKTLGIASSNKDGKPKTVPADEKETENNAFLKLDKSNVVENFISNYLRQAKDPTQITFHRIPKNLLKTALKSFKDLKSNLYDPIAQSFFNKYEVDTGKIKKDVLNPLNNSDMAKKTDEQKQVSPAEEAKQAAAANTNQPKETRYTMGMVDWTGLRNLGITPENLKERGMLDQVLNGGKPKETVDKDLSANFDMYLYRKHKPQVTVKKVKPDFGIYDLFGLTAEDKTMITNSKGQNAQTAVEFLYEERAFSGDLREYCKENMIVCDKGQQVCLDNICKMAIRIGCPNALENRANCS